MGATVLADALDGRQGDGVMPHLHLHTPLSTFTWPCPRQSDVAEQPVHHARAHALQRSLHDHHLLDPNAVLQWSAGDAGLDLAQLDALAVDLHLEVCATDVVQLTGQRVHIH